MGDNTGRLSPYDMAVRSDLSLDIYGTFVSIRAGHRALSGTLQAGSAPLEFRPAHSAYAALHHPNTEDCAKRKIVSPHSLTFYRAIINTRRPLSQKAGAVINKNIHLRPNPGSMDIHGMERDWELGRPWHCPSDATQSRSTAIPALYCISVQGHSVCASSCACVWNGAKSEVTRRWGCLSDWIPNTFMCFT